MPRKQLLHIANLQEEFSFNLKPIKTHHSNISDAETQRILKQAMKSSNRWAVMKDLDKSDDEIIASFSQKQKMTVFTWKGEKIP
jgi:penicillin-binding protein 1A